MVVVFLSGLPPCLGAGDTIVAKVREDFRKGFPIIEDADALFGNRAIFYDNRNPHLMYSATFVTRNDDPIPHL